MNLQRTKIFGFQRFQTQFKFYDPKNTQYLFSKYKGYFEAPKFSKNRSLNFLADQYKQRQEYEKYMNPKGLKYTYTSNFPKNATEIQQTNPNIFLVRSEKKYPANFAKFAVPMNYSKFEIKQFLQKMYKMEVRNIHISILPGKIKHDPKIKGFKRTRDVKRALVEFGSFVDLKFRRIKSDNNNRVSMDDFVAESKKANEEEEEEMNKENEGNERKDFEFFDTKRKKAQWKREEYLKKIEENKIKQKMEKERNDLRKIKKNERKKIKKENKRKNEKIDI